jgi:pseudomonalisin
MLNVLRSRYSFVELCFLLLWSIAAAGQQPAFRLPADRVTEPIDDSRLVTLDGNVHLLPRGAFDLGPAAGETPMRRMLLHLEPSAEQQVELDALTDAQQDPASPLYRDWLTPAQYGARFGVSPADLAQIVAWLQEHGFSIDEVAEGRSLIEFSGTAGHVAETFHTQMHRYRVDRVEHIANSQDPQIPAALAGVVGGVVSLHDFRRRSETTGKRALISEPSGATNRGAGAHPEYSDGAVHNLFPADWATIYDLNPLYNAGKTGSGTSIAIVGRSNINLADVSSFRSVSGLPANNPTVIMAGVNPGIVAGDQDESTLDVEWSGAVAPAAAVKFVIAASTAATDGIDLAAQYAVNHATAPIMSTSYGSCEQEMGTTELAFYNHLWQQAAAEGISAFVSSGDSGAAGCDSGSATKGTVAAVNGLCSSPYSTCVGGTEFNEGASSAKYWSASNSSTYESAQGYIPEKVWNESALDGGSGLWASTGGISTVYAQPSWQAQVTSATHGMRAVPDVAITAAAHDGYIINENGSFYVIGGTSAASPSFAAVMALVVQANGGSGLGNANPSLYSLPSAAHNPFHATPSGNNSVPNVAGYTASGGVYNLATGLGSVDGAMLVNNWPKAGAAPSGVNFALTQSASSGTVQAGQSISFQVSATQSGSARYAIALTAKTPAGVTAVIHPSAAAAGSTVIAVVTLTAAASTKPGELAVTVNGSDSSGSRTLSYALSVLSSTGKAGHLVKFVTPIALPLP